MKKIILFILTAVLFACCLSACSAGAADSKATGSSEADASASAAAVQTVPTQEAETPIEEAQLSAAEATEKIKGYSAKQLGLEGKIEDYKFMVATKGKRIDKEEYIEVAASKVTAENEDGSVSMETKGTYFIRYDGKQVLRYDLKTGAYSELK